MVDPPFWEYEIVAPGRIKDQGSDQGSRIKDQGSKIKDHGSKIKDQGSKIGSRIKDKDQGSRLMDLVQPRMSILEEIWT